MYSFLKRYWTEFRVLSPKVTLFSAVISLVAVVLCNVDAYSAEDDRRDFPRGRIGGGTHMTDRLSTFN
jgi:hypothetical protein